MTDFLSLAAMIVIGAWLWSSLRSGELRFRGSSTKREDDPEIFRIGCALLALLFGATILSLLGVIPKHLPS